MPQSPPLARREGFLGIGAGEVLEFFTGLELRRDLLEAGGQGGVGFTGIPGELQHAHVRAILLVKAVLVLVVEGLDLHRAHDALRLALLLAHVAEDDFLGNFLPVLAEGGAALAEVGEELGAVVVELLGLDLGNAVVDEAVRDVLLLVLHEVLHDQLAIDEVLDDVILQGLELFVEFLLVVGIGLDLRDQRLDFPADIVDRDDLALDDRGDAVGKAQVEAVIGPGGGGVWARAGRRARLARARAAVPREQRRDIMAGCSRRQ